MPRITRGPELFFAMVERAGKRKIKKWNRHGAASAWNRKRNKPTKWTKTVRRESIREKDRGRKSLKARSRRIKDRKREGGKSECKVKALLPKREIYMYNVFVEKEREREKVKDRKRERGLDSSCSVNNTPRGCDRLAHPRPSSCHLSNAFLLFCSFALVLLSRAQTRYTPPQTKVYTHARATFSDQSKCLPFALERFLTSLIIA